ncbi:UPF0262 family protein [Hyphomicrobium sp.]|jgi:uncharacterized protein (UPF0262 family)|uniref:UPF0262 family protein n=1 Tax=Hyphomicrobium sp. TaxID=82 RepID=UPI002D08F931|nr:UPF0262 family protein [Hyphomicrobium sp.]HVZ04456.1 UPF0262 family protein [Hyphomicrobium sp.]
MDQAVSTVERSRDRLADITLDTKSLGRANANTEHEREVAIFDILDGNSFRIEDLDDGPYKLHLSVIDDRLQMSIVPESAGTALEHAIALTPLKRIMKDYFMICESYYEAVRTAPPARIQAIDVSRRALHDEGSTLLRDKLLPKIIVDEDTARRLFTLVCTLHWKG